jgi:rod shape determining protein RodA
MNYYFSFLLKKINWFLILNVILLITLGLFSIFSSSLYKKDFSNFIKQIIFAAVGLFLCLIVSFFDYRFFKENSYFLLFLYFISLCLMAGLFFVEPVRGAKAWYKIGVFSFDPVELLKIVLILIWAKYFSLRHIESYNLFNIFVSFSYLIFPIIFSIFQNNLGSVLVLALTWFIIVILSGMRLRSFLILIFLIFLFTSIFFIFLLKDYQKQRILSFLFYVDPWGMSWNQNQSKIAIGSGGFFGKGFTQGTQAKYGFLPESQTDFIFAAFCEEFGFLGGILLFILFFNLFWQLLKISSISKNNFARLFIFGWTASLFVQFFINAAMNLGLLPVIGISLPFFSYGGSSLIFNFLALGIVESIYSRA